MLDKKRVNTLVKKADIYQYYDRNGAKLSLRSRIPLVTKKKFESATNLKH